MKIIELAKDYNPWGDEILKIRKGSKFQVLEETENGYKLKYLGVLPKLDIDNTFYTDIYHLGKHWFKDESEFKLPEKWYIKATESNYISIDTYFHSIGNLYKGYEKSWTVTRGYFYVFPQLDKGCWGHYHEHYLVINGYKKITFDQFKKYVLNQNNLEVSINDINLSLNDIETKLLKYYDKDDVNEIIKILKT